MDFFLQESCGPIKFKSKCQILYLLWGTVSKCIKGGMWSLLLKLPDPHDFSHSSADFFFFYTFTSFSSSFKYFLFFFLEHFFPFFSYLMVNHIPLVFLPCISLLLLLNYIQNSLISSCLSPLLILLQITTDLRHRCTDSHTGTSASAPMAAAIIALALEAK